MGPLFSQPDYYRRLVRRLIYLTHTRHDLVYTVQVLSQFMSQPQQKYLDAVIRLLRYIKGTPVQGILLPSNTDHQLRAFILQLGQLSHYSPIIDRLFCFSGSFPFSW